MADFFENPAPLSTHKPWWDEGVISSHVFRGPQPMGKSDWMEDGIESAIATDTHGVL